MNGTVNDLAMSGGREIPVNQRVRPGQFGVLLGILISRFAGPLRGFLASAMPQTEKRARPYADDGGRKAGLMARRIAV